MVTMSQNNATLNDMLLELGDTTSGNKITLNEIVETLGSRSYGFLFIITALLTLLPTGLVPGVPILVMIIICLIAGQMFRAEDAASLPDTVGAFSFSRKLIKKLLDVYEPHREKIEQYVHPRMPELFTPNVTRITAGVAMFFAASFLPLMFLSWGVMIPSAALIVMGVGIMVRDGALVIGSVGVMFTALVFLPLFLA